MFSRILCHPFFAGSLNCSNGQTGFEGLLTGRLERTGDRWRLRFRIGVGHGIVQHFGAPEWRILAGVELIGQRSGRP